MSNTSANPPENIFDENYKYGFSTDIASESFPMGLNEDIVRLISAKMNEPNWMLKKRLNAFAVWKNMKEPAWAKVSYPPIDYQNSYYYSAPKKKDENAPMTLDDIDPKIKETYDKLGVPLHEQEIFAGVQKPRVAVDAVFDSISVATTYKEELKKHGIIFCPISEAITKHSDLVQKYFSTVVPPDDNFFAALNT
ncbi:MAG: Fe-S cluster assembly protein SufB, partial [Alphaproteobacteria bacterium]|nr:Fe-S cluster assembly protein SufB [Alphaproteobacteria bacterium]